MSCCNPKIIDKGEEKKESLDLVCPKCKDKGTKVQTITLRSLLKECCQREVERDIPYKFCKNSECEVVYFSSKKGHFFTKDELRVKATLKDAGLDVNVCYCFGHTRQSVLDELKSTGKTNVLDDVKVKMKDPGCFCETSNPQGNCCLGNITAWIKEAKGLIND